MIRKLRWSFVRVTMISAALVLVILMGLVNVLNYVQRDSADRAILSVLAENGGRIPSDFKGGRFQHGPRVTAADLYGASYFSVTLSADGWLIGMDNSRAAWIETEDAAAVARAVQSTGKDAGVSGDYKYTAVPDRMGNTVYIFLVWSPNMAAMRSFLADSAIVTAAGLVVLFFLAWLLSGRAIRPITESYEKQKTFITNAGHELKTPLAVIESSTDVIELENGESPWTQSIHGQVARLATLTRELTDLARMDEGGAALTLVELDLSAAVAEALEPYALLAERNGFAFVTELQPGIVLKSDRAAVEKLCILLADNAVKYTAPGGTIRFTLAREGGHAVLREENPAEGLAPGKQEKLFDRFYRGDESRSSIQPGYGLGLPLARSLAMSLGGSITAESPDGNRLIFTVRF